jgi:hypothetical protein
MTDGELGAALAAFLAKPLDFSFSELTPAALAACFADPAADGVRSPLLSSPCFNESGAPTFLATEAEKRAK